MSRREDMKQHVPCRLPAALTAVHNRNRSHRSLPSSLTTTFHRPLPFLPDRFVPSSADTMTTSSPYSALSSYATSQAGIAMARVTAGASSTCMRSNLRARRAGHGCFSTRLSSSMLQATCFPLEITRGATARRRHPSLAISR